MRNAVELARVCMTYRHGGMVLFNAAAVPRRRRKVGHADRGRGSELHEVPGGRQGGAGLP